MVNYGLGIASWLNLYGLDAAICCHTAGYVVVTPKVVAVGWDVDRDGRNNSVRLTELRREVPFARVIHLRHSHDNICIAHWRALIYPGYDGIDFFLF